MPIIGHGLIVVVLTILTQLGGLAWAVAWAVGRWRLAVFAVAYGLLWLGATLAAPAFGRVPLNCAGDGSVRLATPLYCALNRHYVTPALADVLVDLDAAVPGGVRVLDANFPFLDGFPLLPHLSHADGRKVDLALPYQVDGRFDPDTRRSPLGYFAFEDGPTNCPPARLSLRWDMGWLQGWWPDRPLDEGRLAVLMDALIADDRVGKVFLEPHLVDRLGLADEKVRFQGCRAARHDDHIHLQL